MRSSQFARESDAAAADNGFRYKQTIIIRHVVGGIAMEGNEVNGRRKGPELASVSY